MKVEDPIAWLSVKNLSRHDLRAVEGAPCMDEEALEACLKGEVPKTIGFGNHPAGYRLIAGVYFDNVKMFKEVFYSGGHIYMRSATCIGEGGGSSTDTTKRERSIREAIVGFCDDLWITNPLDHLDSKPSENISAAYKARGYGSWQ